MCPKFILNLSNDIFFCNVSQFSLLKLFNNDYFFDISIAYIHRKINSFMKRQLPLSFDLGQNQRIYQNMINKDIQLRQLEQKKMYQIHIRRG